MWRWPAVLLLAVSLHAQTARDLKLERTSPPLPDKKSRWALVVGVSSYMYAPPSAQLRYAHRDAEEFAKLLRSPEGGGFPGANVRLLTNESATLGSVRASLHTWLPKSAGPNDVVYLFFAGHAVVAERGESYFVAHDSDPQNLHATAVSFREVNQMLTSNLKAATVVLLADACHAGGIGWTNDPSEPSTAQSALESLGTKDRAFLKLLASRPSEKSFEDERWGGGHGVFTYSILTALRGAAERDKDGFVRVSELIDYISRVVPQETGTKQNPRIAGNFEARLALASLPVELRKEAPASATLRITGRPSVAVYLDGQFRGSIRPNGELLVETAAGPHQLSIESPGEEPFEQAVTAKAGQNLLDVQKSSEFALFRFRSVLRTGTALEALKTYRSSAFPAAHAPVAETWMTAALEETGQECVSDYVQSTTNSLKGPMFLRSAEAFEALRSLRPDDRSLEARSLFCRARAEIAAGSFPQAVANLNASIAIDKEFACSYNALGVALSRLNRTDEARAAFETAAKLTPAWALPPLQIAQQLLAAGDIRGALPHLELAAKLHPRSLGIQWSLARLYRVSGRGPDFLRAAAATIAVDRNYAPIYSELGQYYEKEGDRAKATDAFDKYLLLAPNFADSTEIRRRAQQNRAVPAPRPASRPAPTLRRESDKKK